MQEAKGWSCSRISVEWCPYACSKNVRTWHKPSSEDNHVASVELNSHGFDLLFDILAVLEFWSDQNGTRTGLVLPQFLLALWSCNLNCLHLKATPTQKRWIESTSKMLTKFFSPLASHWAVLFYMQNLISLAFTPFIFSMILTLHVRI